MYEYADGVTELAMKYETHVPRSLSSPEDESKGRLRGSRSEGKKEVAKDVHQVVVEVKKEVEVEVEKEVEVEVEGEVEVKEMVAVGGEKEGEKEAVKEGGLSEEPVTGRKISSCHFNIILFSSPLISHTPLFLTRHSLLLNSLLSSCSINHAHYCDPPHTPLSSPLFHRLKSPTIISNICYHCNTANFSNS
jgi:hypothetical protein